jgi:hypothetical protein
LKHFFEYEVSFDLGSSRQFRDSDDGPVLVIEVREIRQNEVNTLFWTLFGLLNPVLKANKGMWRVPLYASPT